ncbi:MAG: phenylalanine--tRNA ligase subunit alpha [Parachlamydiales bacterium]|nr:phenylalanine--tRNA ligase subunit alpha [Parachlamydiales bacterium]
MKSKIEAIRNQFSKDIEDAKSAKDVEALKVKYLGKKGPVQDLMRGLKDVTDADRPHVGKWINDLKEDLMNACMRSLNELEQKEESERLSHENIDVTLPGRRHHLGRRHIVNQFMDEIVDIFIEMGFSIQEGPEIESDYYNFEALNFSKDHPARDMQDTFYITEDMLLRTHTTNLQVRLMETQKPPIRVLSPGRVYRNEEISARSHVFFHQVEAMYIDKGVTFGDLIATLESFLVKLFGAGIKSRFRPSYFPFVEPGLEVDIQCLLCRGKGCGICKHSGWLEVLGAGMIHPEVLRNGGIDPETYTGYAWGMGLERMILIKHRIKDIRILTQNDLRFLEQF